MDLIPQTNLVFIHIPKTAGLAVRAMFAIPTDGYQHSIDSSTDVAYLGESYVRFTVVRDPLSRFISAFKYNAGISSSQPTGVRRHLAERPDLREDINTFTAFIRETYDPLHKATAHLHRQMHYIEHCKPHILLRQETLETDIQIVRTLATPASWQGNVRRNVSSDRFELGGVNLELSDETLAFIESYYHDDFRLLGYPLPTDR